MIITTELIANMNPCKDRFDNFTANYPNYSGELADFLSLSNITYSDKLWVGVRLLNRNSQVAWSIACAKSVQHIFDDAYPNNPALTNLFSYLDTIKDFTRLSIEEINTIRKLQAAAYASGGAAAYAAYAAAYAAGGAAAYAASGGAAAAYAAYAAAYAAAAAADDAKEEQSNLNLLFLCFLIEEGI